MKQEMKVIELSGFKRAKFLWGGSQPYTLAFCYPKEGPLLIKGMGEEVEKYVKNKVGTCHFRITYWMEGKSRGYWRINRSDAYIHLTNDNKDKHQRYHLVIYSDKRVIVDKWMRRVPEHFMRELEVLE